MKHLYYTIFYAVLLLCLTNCSDPVALNGLTLKTKANTKKEICKNVSGCLGIYMAPWCGACQGTIPLINELSSASNFSKLNFVAVVGGDREENLRNFAGKIQGQVFIDSESRFENATRYSSVPRWFIVNSQQQIVSSFSMGYLPDGPASKKIDYILENYADLLRK